MNREENYRKRAIELREQARNEPNVSSRSELKLLALGYDRLADQAARNAQTDVDYKYAPQSVERQRKRQAAQVQQQQQRQPPGLKRPE